jgi:hypothetical protein
VSISKSLTGAASAGVLGVAFLFFGSPLAGQTNLDVSTCFNNLLQQKNDLSSVETLKLATLAQVSESTYESAKHDASLAATFKFVPISADYKDFSEKRRDFFQLNKLDMESYKAISTSSRTLGPDAYKLISECIRTLAASQFGLHYVATVEDENSATIQFFWKPTTGADPIAVTDSVLENATVVGGNVEIGKLFPYVAWWSLSRYPRFTSASAAILLKRADTSKPIRASITSRPLVQSSAIVIPPLPPPLKEPVYQTVYDETNSAGQPYVVTRTFQKNSYGTSRRRGCSDCFEVIITSAVDGPITSLNCTVPDPGWFHQEVCTFDGTTARWEGFTNTGDPRTVILTIHYKVARQVCIQNCAFAATTNH